MMKYRIMIVILFLLSLHVPAFAGSITYTYDEMDRLREVILENGQHIIYSYDQIGNRISKTLSGSVATINSSALTGGSIYPNGSILFTDGQNTTYSITPSSGYVIANIIVDGVPQGALPSYVFSNVTTNHTIKALFDIDHSGCSNPPVRIARATPVYFTSLQAAYDVAANGETIQAQTYLLIGNFVANHNIAVTIDGGYTCAFNSNPGSTTLYGSATTSSGTVTMRNFRISN